MSDDGRGLMLDYMEARMREQDERDHERIEAALRRAPIVGDLCKRGHDEWGQVRTRYGFARKCLACHRERMAEARRKGRTA